jgi:hypothetical protein
VVGPVNFNKEIPMKKIFIYICCAAWLFTSSAFAGEEKVSQGGVATIIGSDSSPARCISPVLINNVDGQELTGGRTILTLEPGTHVISGAAQVDTSFCHSVGISRGGRKSKTEPLEAEFEAGKTYYFGLNHRASRESSWHYEIWKVEDSK